jgi:hypothetical protein
MNTNKKVNTVESDRTSKTLFAIGIVALLTGLIIISAASAFGQKPAADQKMFATPDEAVDALVAAAEAFDEASFKEILGPNSYDIMHSGEPAVDREVAAEFASKAKEKKAITYAPRVRNRAFLVIGNDDWPFPIPLAKAGGKWFFDTDAGRQEILYRRVGRNELTAIQICRGFVEAQHEYALSKHDDAIVNQYAQRIISSPGKQDGLAWQNPDGTWGGTVGEKAAKAIEKSYTGTPGAFHGYHFKVLKGQGAAAPMGEMNFVVDGAMIGGFALLAYPSVYGVTGVKTFMVSHDGVVYEKDLGPDTLKTAAGIELFNPDRTWSPVLE